MSYQRLPLVVHPESVKRPLFLANGAYRAEVPDINSVVIAVRQTELIELYKEMRDRPSAAWQSPYAPSFLTT